MAVRGSAVRLAGELTLLILHAFLLLSFLLFLLQLFLSVAQGNTSASFGYGENILGYFSRVFKGG